MDEKEKEDYIQRMKLKLAYVRRQINEIRPLKQTDGHTWWEEYKTYKTKECIIEQELIARGVPKEEVEDRNDQR